MQMFSPIQYKPNPRIDKAIADIKSICEALSLGGRKEGQSGNETSERQDRKEVPGQEVSTEEEEIVLMAGDPLAPKGKSVVVMGRDESGNVRRH